MKLRGRRMWLQRLQWALLIVGVASLTWCGYAIGRAYRFQARQHAAMERMLASGTHGESDGPLNSSRGVAPGLIGELEMPRLKLSAVVMEGDDEDTLEIAVGHLPDTPLPWQTGNSALAGHRDSFFRALKGVRLGDEIRLMTRHGDFRYRVDRTLVVEPDDLSVLEASPGRRLTLITCFPFSYFGDAPRRFVVQAQPIVARLDGSGHSTIGKRRSSLSHPSTMRLSRS